MTTITTDFAPGDSTAVVNTKLSTIAQYWGGASALTGVTTYGGVRTVLNGFANAANQIADQELGASFITKLNWLNNIENVVTGNLFGASEPGVWFDPSDLTTLFQDSAGTPPVTAPGQPVGLMLDKSQGLVLGPELLTNGDFATDTNWTKGAGWSISGGQAIRTTPQVGGTNLSQAYTDTGKVLSITIVVQSVSVGSGSFTVRFTGGTQVIGPTISAAGTYTFLLRGNGTNTFFSLAANNGDVACTVDSVSAKEVMGNHAVQATSASRPIYGINPLGGRRNLGLMTSFTSVTGTAGNQVPNAAGWSNINNTGGTRTYVASSQFPGDQALNIAGVTVARNTIAYTITPLASTTYTVSFWIESVSGVNGFVSYAIGAQTSGQINDPTSTGRVSYTFTSDAVATAVQIRFGVGASGNASGSIRISGIQVEVGSTATAYQRVTTQYDVTQAGVASLSYLAFDGVDDGMVTSTITPGTDKVQAFSGVRKLSDAALGIFCEFSASTASFDGVFRMSYPSIGGAAGYGFLSRGTTSANANVGSGFAAPITNVVTGIGDISGDVVTQRVNGTQVATSSGDQGTGNYLAYPLYIGRRGGTTLPFTGNFYSLIVRFGANLTTAQISQWENYTNDLTGAY
jgi:hypothetical protein